MKIQPEIENQYLNEVLCNTSIKDLAGENWKAIEGMDNYAVSNFGRIKSLERWTEFPSGNLRKEHELIRKLAFREYFNKYLNRNFHFVQCGFSIDGIHYTKSVARLVYYHFVEEFDIDDHSIAVSYKDGDSLHLHYKNLELLSSKEKSIKAIQKNRAKRLGGWTSDNNVFFAEDQIIPLNLMGKAYSNHRYLYIRLNRKKKRTLLIISRLMYCCFVKQFDINDRTLVIDNQNESIWDIDISKLSLCSINSLLNQKKIDQRNQSQ